MTAERPSAAYWHSKGSLMQKVGTSHGLKSAAISMSYARGLVRFYANEAEQSFAAGDRLGARYCARTCEDLIRAISDCEQWQAESCPTAQIVPLFPNSKQPQGVDR